MRVFARRESPSKLVTAMAEPESGGAGSTRLERARARIRRLPVVCEAGLNSVFLEQRVATCAGFAARCGSGADAVTKTGSYQREKMCSTS